MTKIILIFLSIGFCSCGQKKTTHAIEPSAIKLNDSALQIAKSMDDSNHEKAILLLDKATKIDSNFYLAYWNKYVFQSELKQYEKAEQTLKNLIRIKPEDPQTYFVTGMFYENTKDTISSEKYFQHAEILYINIFDTLHLSNKKYGNFCLNRAINLIMSGDTLKGNTFLKKSFNSETNKDYKEYIASFINKNKNQILKLFSNPNKNSQQ